MMQAEIVAATKAIVSSALGPLPCPASRATSNWSRAPIEQAATASQARKNADTVRVPPRDQLAQGPVIANVLVGLYRFTNSVRPSGE